MGAPFPKCAVCLHENLLHDIARLIGVAGNADCKAEHHVAMPLHDRLERIRIARKDQFNDFRVVHLLSLTQDSENGYTL